MRAIKPMSASHSAGASARALCAMLAVLALLLRIAIPSGWMPMLGPDGVSLSLCPGTNMAAGATMPGMGARDDRRPAGHDHTPPERPCDFAAAALALDGSAQPPVVTASPAPSDRLALPFGRDAGAVGRGLAAPPPPATGPPTLG